MPPGSPGAYGSKGTKQTKHLVAKTNSGVRRSVGPNQYGKSKGYRSKGVGNSRRGM